MPCAARRTEAGARRPAGAFRRIGGLGARDTRLILAVTLLELFLLGEGTLSQVLGGSFSADAFFADVLAQLENGTPLPDGWREAAARTPLGEREQTVLSGLADALGGEEDAVLRALRAAAQALRGTLMERERQSARDTRLVTTLCFSLSLLVTILLI